VERGQHGRMATAQNKSYAIMPVPFIIFYTVIVFEIFIVKTLPEPATGMRRVYPPQPACILLARRPRQSPVGF